MTPDAPYDSRDCRGKHDAVGNSAVVLVQDMQQKQQAGDQDCREDEHHPLEHILPDYDEHVDFAPA
jgi:hypothetical protein